MKRLLCSCAVAVVALGIIASGSSANNGQGPQQDMVSGTANLLVTVPFFGTFPSKQHLDANADPDAVAGFPAQGHFFTRIYPDGIFAFLGEQDVSGDTLCLDVQGNQAIDRGVITTASGAVASGLVGTQVIGKHIDNGSPGSSNAGATPPDEAGGISLGTPPAPNPTCPPGNAAFPTHPVEQGNFVVKDGQ